MIKLKWNFFLILYKLCDKNQIFLSGNGHQSNRKIIKFNKKVFKIHHTNDFVHFFSHSVHIVVLHVNTLSSTMSACVFVSDLFALANSAIEFSLFWALVECTNEHKKLLRARWKKSLFSSH